MMEVHLVRGVSRATVFYPALPWAITVGYVFLLCCTNRVLNARHPDLPLENHNSEGLFKGSRMSYNTYCLTVKHKGSWNLFFPSCLPPPVPFSLLIFQKDERHLEYIFVWKVFRKIILFTQCLRSGLHSYFVWSWPLVPLRRHKSASSVTSPAGACHKVILTDAPYQLSWMISLYLMTMNSWHLIVVTLPVKKISVTEWSFYLQL